jgi:vacuolar-type H+-ATPase catalytic subunit A/Vma1
MNWNDLGTHLDIVFNIADSLLLLTGVCMLIAGILQLSRDCIESSIYTGITIRLYFAALGHFLLLSFSAFL